MKRQVNRSRDTNHLVKSVVDVATGERGDSVEQATKLNRQRRPEITRRAAMVPWSKENASIERSEEFTEERLATSPLDDFFSKAPYRGVAFKRSRWAIYSGESLEVLKQIPDDCVNCVITSPPYFWLRDYGVDGQIGMEETVEEYVQNLTDIFDQVRRVLRKDGLFS